MVILIVYLTLKGFVLLLHLFIYVNVIIWLGVFQKFSQIGPPLIKKAGSTSGFISNNW